MKSTPARMKSARRVGVIGRVALTATALSVAMAMAIPAAGEPKPGDCIKWEWPSSVVIHTSDGWVLSGRGLGTEARDFSITTVAPAMSPIMAPGMFLDGSLNTNSPNYFSAGGKLSLRGGTQTEWNLGGMIDADGRFDGFANRGEFTMDGRLFCTAKEPTP